MLPVRQSRHSLARSDDMKQGKPRRDFSGRRWLTVVLRSLHLAAVVLLGAALLGGHVDRQLAAMSVFYSGLALYALDLWSNPGYFGELAGLFIPVKLLLVLAMVFYPESADGLFWLLLIVSSVVSHAPGNFRHMRIWG
jgi:hypothetical protein